MAYEGERVVKSTGSYIYRMLTPDSIVPNPANPQSFNRYSYGYNNPVKYSDPSGHIACDVLGTEQCSDDGSFIDAPAEEGIQYDLTSWLGSEMLANLFSEELNLVIEFMRMESDPQIAGLMAAGGGSGFLAAQGAWFELTRDYGIWDLKREMEDVIGKAVVLCGETSCGWFDYSVPGNIHYGFLAAAAGIPREESYWAAGLLELVGGLFGDGDPGDFNTRYENPADKAAVDLGYDLFDTHGYGFVPNDLRTALTPAVMYTLQKPPIIPAVAAEPQENRYPIGAFNYGQ